MVVKEGVRIRRMRPRMAVAQFRAYRDRIREALGNPDPEIEQAWWLRKRPELADQRPWDIWHDALAGDLGPADLEYLVEVARG